MDERRRNLRAFKEGDVRFLICTDVAARGIDVRGLPYVINATLPEKSEDYVHRVGRVGRADAMGLAVSVVSSAPEKVWYCQKKGYKPWFKPSRDDRTAHSAWIDEAESLRGVEKRLGAPVARLGADFSLPRNSPRNCAGAGATAGRGCTAARGGTGRARRWPRTSPRTRRRCVDSPSSRWRRRCPSGTSSANSPTSTSDRLFECTGIVDYRRVGERAERFARLSSTRDSSRSTSQYRTSPFPTPIRARDAHPSLRRFVSSRLVASVRVCRRFTRRRRHPRRPFPIRCTWTPRPSSSPFVSSRA